MTGHSHDDDVPYACNRSWTIERDALQALPIRKLARIGAVLMDDET